MSFPAVATWTSLLVSLCLLLEWGFVISGSEAYVVQKQGASHLVVSVSSLLPAKTCYTPKGVSSRRGNSLRISHRDGPCSSPLSTVSHSNEKEYYRQLLLEDQKRVVVLQKKPGATGGAAANDTKLRQSAATVPVRRGRALGTGNYIVTVGIGTPKKDQTVAFDTGSSLCWVQCRPCVRSCYPQEEPIFDPVASSSYINVSCSEPACGKLFAKGCSDKSCLYGVRYGDSSSSVGFLSKDSLTVTTASGADDVFPEFVFGCGQNNQGLYGRTAGLLGFSRDPLSLGSQTANRYGNVFSYCLPASMSSTGYLSLGPSDRSGSGSVTYTPMLSSPKDPDLYFLRMSGITVRGQQLPLSSSDLSGGGTIIDSGTVITRLPPTVYAALRSAFRSAMSEYTLGEPLGLLDTCYDLTGKDTVTLPKIKLEFDGGAVADLDAVGILFIVDISQVCLAFAGNAADSDIAIIGNVQQRTLEVVYDLGHERIGFGPGSCHDG